MTLLYKGYIIISQVEGKNLTQERKMKMYTVTYSKKLDNDLVETHYENFLTNAFIPDFVKNLVERGYTEISITNN